MSKIFLTILGALFLIFIMALIMALPTMYLWNWLITDIFGLTNITFSQALGINIFTGILFRNAVSNG